MKEFSKMNTNSKRLSIYIVLMLIGTAIATTLRSIACVTDLNNVTGYFDDKSLIAISDPLIWITVIASLSYIFAASRVKLTASFSTAATYIPTGILGVATLFLGVRVITHTIETNDSPILSPETLLSPAFILSVLAAILSIASIGYYFLNSYYTESSKDVRAIFAVFTIAFFAIYAMLIYFDGSVPINNPSKIINQMAYLFAAMFFLYEARISLGREMWRAYTAFGLAATALTAYSSIPALITYYVDGTVVIGSHAGAFTSIEEYMLTFALFIFILSKLILTVNLREESENEYIKVMSEYASVRDAEVEDSFERFQEGFASKQLSIFELYGVDDIPEEEEAEDTEEIAEAEEKAPKEVMISDDAIYEAIFGKMPDKEEPEEQTDEVEEEKDPEALADELLSALDEAKKEDKE